MGPQSICSLLLDLNVLMHLMIVEESLKSSRCLKASNAEKGQGHWELPWGQYSRWGMKGQGGK